MNMDSAAVFLAGSLLYALGCLIILVAVVIANNVIHNYWKSWGWKFMTWHTEPARFMTQEEYEQQKASKKV